MITNIILSFIVWILNLILAIFPASTGFNANIVTAINQIGGYTTIINTLVPMDTLGYIFGLVIAFEILLFTFKGIRFIVSYIPVIGGK